MPPTKKAKTAGGSTTNLFADKIFAISGTLSSPRKHFEGLITSNGGKLGTSVTKNTDYLVTTPYEIRGNTVKVQTAKVEKIPMVSEQLITEAISTGNFPDDISDYVLDGSTAVLPTAPSSSSSTTKRVTKPRTPLVEAEPAAAEEAPAKPTAAKRGTGEKAGKKSKVEEESETKKEEPKKEETKQSSNMEVDPKPALDRGVSTLEMKDKNSEVVFSFDTTGSMYPCLTQVRRKINETVERLFEEIGDKSLRIGITAHGDYCDAPYSYVTKHLPMTSDIKRIVNFVENVGGTSGGDAPECYELVLREAQDFPWTPGWNHVLVLIGDELPHEANQNPAKIDWKEELDKLHAKGIVVHGVQALNRKHATKFYSTCANKTGGVHLSLDQFNSIADLVIAVCFRESRPGRLESYEKEVRAAGRYNRSVQTMFDKMLGRTAVASAAPGDLRAVPAGRFQILDVDHDTPIRDFVNAQGVTYKTGRGFYEFNKPELIQDYKEVILVDKKTGDMFEGDYARSMLGLPEKGSKKVVPDDYDFYVFVQSTSYNRKLLGGTRFLYEVEDFTP